MRTKLRIFITKLNVAVCAIGTYFMAFVAADFIRRDLPLDFVSAAGVILCNLMVLYLFIESGFDLNKVLEAEEEPDESPTITAEGFADDFFEGYFSGKSNAG